MRDILESLTAITLILGASFILVGTMTYSLAWIVYLLIRPSPSDYWPIVHAITMAATVFVAVGSITSNGK